ncbi:MAG: hypothetical protein VX955_00125, partial [Pseudomonadota bacterium]|nr:hypothetical protein [Pseudomonadota bacterium]
LSAASTAWMFSKILVDLHRHIADSNDIPLCIQRHLPLQMYNLTVAMQGDRRDGPERLRNTRRIKGARYGYSR